MYSSNQQHPTHIRGEDSPLTLAVSFTAATIVGVFGLASIFGEHDARLHCQRDNSTGHCQLVETGWFGQSQKQNFLLQEIQDVTHEEPIESQSFGLLKTQTGEIRLNRFTPSQVKNVQSFLKDSTQKNLTVQQDRRPASIIVGSFMLLVGVYGISEVSQKLVAQR